MRNDVLSMVKVCMAIDLLFGLAHEGEKEKVNLSEPVKSGRKAVPVSVRSAVSVASLFVFFISIHTLIRNQ